MDRPAVFRAVDFRAPDREDLRALFRAELRPPLFADLLPPRVADLAPRLADLRALFLAPFRVDFLLPLLALLADRPEDFLDPLRLRERLRDPLLPPDRPVVEGSSKSKDGDELGAGEGVFSEGSGSIHPEPDQPISIK